MSTTTAPVAPLRLTVESPLTVVVVYGKPPARSNVSTPPLPLSTSAVTPTNVEALLAQLRIDRSNGFVLQDSGFEPGVASVAAPLRDVAGEIVAAINVSAVTILTREGELHGALKTEILKAADALSRDLGADRNQAMEDA